MSTTTPEDRGSAAALAACRAQGRSALIGYLPVGYPDVPGSIDAVRALVAGGADMVEIGMPYTDPGLDGPVIEAASVQALRGGVRVRDVFTAVQAAADAGATPVVMSYWNLVLQYGVTDFARGLDAAGGGGIITPDLIPDEAHDWGREHNNPRCIVDLVKKVTNVSVETTRIVHALPELTLE